MTASGLPSSCAIDDGRISSAPLHAGTREIGDADTELTVAPAVVDLAEPGRRLEGR
jgi:hypothetical protein